MRILNGNSLLAISSQQCVTGRKMAETKILICTRRCEQSQMKTQIRNEQNEQKKTKQMNLQEPK